VLTLMRPMSKRSTEQRVLLGLFGVQVCAAIAFVAFWTWGAKAPGPAVAAGLILILFGVLRQGFVSPRLAIALAVLISGLGLSYPWPWVQYEQQQSEFQADVRRLAGPEGCTCVGLVVDQVWGAEEKPSGQAEAFCMPSDDERLAKWVSEGRVSTTWTLTYMRMLFDAPVLFARGLEMVDGQDANALRGNNGCDGFAP
jgi:hypothetical protein